MFSFSPGQVLVEHALVDISWVMVGNYVKRKKWCLMKRWAKLSKVKKKKQSCTKREKEKEKCSFVFLRFCVDGAWNQKKLSIGA